jgi:MoaA/NifB/PqqE/SkfB family radical SAM enzyme
MIRLAAARGMGTALITNGWLLPSKLDELSAAGLNTIYISIDAPSITAHETNRGLKHLVERIRAATSRTQKLGITVLAQVTISKLIDDYTALGTFLRTLGFEAVAFSYPQRARLGSTSLAWSETSKLVNFTDGELASALTGADSLRRSFPVSNPSASMADIKRHLLGKAEHFVCYGGYKSFYLDWNFDIWRCDAWHEPMCSVWDFDKTSLIRDGCTACIGDCYRDSSVMLHFAVSLGDAFDSLGEGRIIGALKLLADRRNLSSLAAVAGNFGVLERLAGLG